MGRIVFLLEEPSMKVLLEGLLPRLFPEINFLCVPHEGKNDLEKSIPRKLRAWREPGVRFVVVMDNDNGDCLELKRKVLELCEAAHRPDTLVRIVCQELEAWYFGDPLAMAEAFDTPGLTRIAEKRKYRIPDDIQNPSLELEKLVPEFQKVSGARKMAGELSKEKNRSRSFQVFVDGVRRIMETGA